MIRAAMTLALLAVIAVSPAPSQAQSDPAPAASAEPDTAAEETGPAVQAGQKWGDGKVARGPRPTKEPAKDAPYNWTFMAYSAGAMVIMLAFVVWLVRRTRRRDRSAR